MPYVVNIIVLSWCNVDIDFTAVYNNSIYLWHRITIFFLHKKCKYTWLCKFIYEITVKYIHITHWFTIKSFFLYIANFIRYLFCFNYSPSSIKKDIYLVSSKRFNISTHFWKHYTQLFNFIIIFVTNKVFNPLDSILYFAFFANFPTKIKL